MRLRRDTLLIHLQIALLVGRSILIPGRLMMIIRAPVSFNRTARVSTIASDSSRGLGGAGVGNRLQGYLVLIRIVLVASSGVLDSCSRVVFKHKQLIQ